MSLSRRNFTRALSAAGVSTLFLEDAAAQASAVFRHGVASGDPLQDRVIIWTRVTPSSFIESVAVEWVVAEDAGFSRVVRRGTTSTSAAFDYTVKVDVTRLNPNTTYYYRFTAQGFNSPVGRTKTTPMGSVDRLRLAVASCSNFPFGFFNAYRMIAQRNDLDAVVHLGDYIYEYAEGEYGLGGRFNRVPFPNRETVSLSDYRQRYAQYRTDPDLQEAHRQHPWIIVWDDHESTNDSWRDGAQNHQPATEGEWAVRRAAAIQAWLEWQPVRENVYEGGTINRTIRFGNLMDLVMLDTRLQGRDQQTTAANAAVINDPNRTLLGAEQESWLFRQLSGSASRNVRWRLIGQQTMMAQLLNTDGTPFNTDQWDGYTASRTKLLNYISTEKVSNVVVLTGDIHSSWANEIAINPFAAATANRLAVEFVGTSITSPGIDDPAQAGPLEAGLLQTPHIKYVNLSRRGYMLIDLNADRAQAEWYFVRTIVERRAEQDFARAFRTDTGTNRLTAVTQPSSDKAGAPPLAL
jgi:alkaline phosphatase D